MVPLKIYVKPYNFGVPKINLFISKITYFPHTKKKSNKLKPIISKVIINLLNLKKQQN